MFCGLNMLQEFVLSTTKRARARTHTHYNNPGAKDVEEVLTPYCSALSITAYACPRPGGGLVPVQRIHKAYIAYHKMYF